MRIVIAPQALKGSLSAAQTGQAIAAGARTVYPDANIDIIPIADGGEGTAVALAEATGGSLVPYVVTGPLGEPVEAYYARLGDGRTAVIEMAASSGLPLVPNSRRDPRITTTYGVGELIRAALDDGCRNFIIGLGGSATNDGGAGMAQALGASLLDAQSQPLPYGGAALSSLAHIDVEKLDSRLRECMFDIACDVTNPLCGREGASAVYGPQKGATPAMVQELDDALAHYAHIIHRDLGLQVSKTPGAGAAGGLGAGLLAFLNARIRPGAQIVLEAVKLERMLATADLVITAEGKLDQQTAYGKSVAAVAEMAKRYQLPVLAVAGGLGEKYYTAYNLGIDGIITLPDEAMSLEHAMKNAERLTREASERALRIFRLGQTSKGRG
ncbi:glycerate kinase [Ktedonospora formicarum]|uniref:Glycerate kinase n=1 Tax=Ktedonospora formicarum TaxID=2778364 RepID=A0A8J3MTC6_9CHLR|nr:glycerate kinase [Ktedonospora formicarum]GHO45478.1 glycerate kinase [Ktedonospora formicarum]